MIIKKKTWPDLFEKVRTGEKKFDMRLADFECQTGDTLILQEWDPETKSYTGREIEKKITFVLKTKEAAFWSQAEIDKYGFVVMSLD